MITPGSVNPLLMVSESNQTTPCGGSVSVPSYVIKNSLRFRQSAGGYLTRAFTAELSVWTASVWVKRGALGNSQVLFCNRSSGSWESYIYFQSNDTLEIRLNSGNTSCLTTAVFRDPSAWMHLVFNGTQNGTANIYANGALIKTAPMGGQWLFTNRGGRNTIGQYGDYNGLYFDGYMADIHFIDGQALDASAFGEFDSVNGVWQPKAYAGAYGANGFWLKFDDAAQIGKDSSGNNNHWTANNIDVAAPGTQATYDLMKDSPVMFDDGTANPPGNYAVLNPLDAGRAGASQGNLMFDTGASYAPIRSTMGVPPTGKYYFEITSLNETGSNFAVSGGVCLPSIALSGELLAAGVWGYYTSTGNSTGGYIQNNGVKVATAIGLTTPAHTIRFVIDMDRRVGWVGRDNVWWDAANGTTGNPDTGVNPSLTNLPDNLLCWVDGYHNNTFVNFGQRPFKYAPPAGFKALCTTNLPYCIPFTKPDGTAPHNATITVAANEFKYLGYAPTAATGVTWGTQLDKLSNGVKAHTAGTYTITNSGERFKTGLAQGNP